jgi:hypothetical protein
METLVIIAIILFTALGLLGCVLPGLPGPPLNYAALLLAQWQYQFFSVAFLVIMGILTVIVLILDYAIPVFGAKIFGATKQGVWGSIIGMVAGMFFSPLGMMGGILIGAILGDLAAGRNVRQAFVSGAGTFIGTLVGMGVKILLALVISAALFYKLMGLLWQAWNG